MKLNFLSVFVAVLALPSLNCFAQARQNLFDGSASIVVPRGASVESLEAPDGSKTYVISYSPSSPSVYVGTYKLVAADRKMSNSQWRADKKSYYTNSKNKQRYKFRNFKFTENGDTVMVEYQSTFKEKGKTYSIRSVYKDIRVNKSTVMGAAFFTPKPGSWNNSRSKQLRRAVASFRVNK